MTDINVKRKLYIISVIIFIYIFILLTGYAFFSKSLTVSGVASTVEYYEGEKLPVIATIRDTKYNRYYTANSSKSFVDFYSESCEGDTYTLNFNKKAGVVAGSKTITYVITFTNPTILTFTDVNITAEITKNYHSRLNSVKGELSKTKVIPGESVDVLFTINFNFLTEFGEHSAKATVSYMYQNKPRYLYFIINYINV